MTDYNPPGQNERSVIPNMIQRIITIRRAHGTISGFDTTVSVEPRANEDGRYWQLKVSVAGVRGTSQTWRRDYGSRTDAYLAFDWYLRQHEDLEEGEVVPENAPTKVQNARVEVLEDA